MTNDLHITPKGITAAAEAIDARFLNTPLLTEVVIDLEGACPMMLKDETANPIKCFKGRGTEYFAHRYASATPKVVCASAGNFGQGLASAMARRNGQAIVFAAKNANPLKIERMKQLGADVILDGVDFDGANEAAKDYAARHKLPFVEDAAFAEFAEGAGTLAREMTEAGAVLDAFYVPVGGGAMINGIGTWLKHAWPEIKIIGVCAEGAPSYALSWRKRKVVETVTVETFADGIAIRTPVLSSVDNMLSVVDDFVLVNDDEILRAMRAVHRSTGIAPEPSGAAGVAAILKDAVAREVKAPASLICGANVTEQQFDLWFDSTNQYEDETME